MLRPEGGWGGKVLEYLWQGWGGSGRGIRLKVILSHIELQPQVKKERQRQREKTGQKKESWGDGSVDTALLSKPES